MNRLDFIPIVIAIFSIFCAVIVIALYRIKMKHTQMRMDAMLTAAIDGSFSETMFDESLLSSVETKLSHYLSASAVSSKNLLKEKNKIKGLITDISHQTKTPIANILLYAQLLREQNLPHESSTCVTELNAQAEKLNFLIESLVKTSRLDANIFKLHSKQSQIQSMLDVVLEQISPKASKKQIEINCIPTNIIAHFDSKWTTEAVYNIVDNAVKYSHDGGLIKIETIAYNLFCRIDITDTGIGIAEQEQAKIFGRFYRSATVSDVEGVGIGLYLSRQIISREGGYIKLKSIMGIGTTFSVFLPIEK